MCLEAAAKHLRDLGYPANANQLWRMCRKGKLKYTVYRKSFYVTHSQLMTALEPEKELSTPAGRSALEAKLSRRPLGHRMAVSLLTARGLMPTPEQQAEALARAQAAERQAVNVSLEGRAHA